jgi:hypothetical protein
VQIGSERRDTGTLYNGSLQYAFSERTRLGASLSESIQPSAVGALQRFNVASVTVSHELSERLSGRASVGYSETTLPTGLSGSFTNTFLSAGAGMTYRLADAWTLEARYSYGRAEYAQAAVAPTANTVLVTLAYNWPGASFSNVFGAGPDAFLGGPGVPSGTGGVSGAPPLPGPATRPEPAGRDAPPLSPGQSPDHKSVSGAP